MEFGTLLAFGLLLVIGFVLKAFTRSRSTRTTSKKAAVPHKTTGYLATPAERKFYRVLCDVVGDRYIVHCQVPLIAVVQPVDWKHASRSWAKRLDFVITDLRTKIFTVIELDDSSHRLKNRV